MTIETAGGEWYSEDWLWRWDGTQWVAATEVDRQRVRDAPPSRPPPSRPASVNVLVRTYKNAREYERDAGKLAELGWMPQGQTSQRGKVNMGRTVGKAVTFLPWAIMRPSRKGDPITVTWVRP